MQPVPRLVPLGLVIAFFIALCFAAGAGRLAAAAAAETLVYKKAGDAELKLFVEKPPGWKAGDRRPAIVFFFGGGWVGGSPNQFLKQSQHFAMRGLVGIRVQYRVIPKGDAGPPFVCVADAKSALRYVRAHAAELGIDPARIAAAGGSAGGHLAASTATLPGLEPSQDDKSVSCIPDALVLFNPALVLAPLPGLELANVGDRVPAERMGTDPKNISPAHHVKKGTPPTIIFHGKADTTVPYATAAAFTTVMKAAGNRCELVGAEGEKHGYFNYGRGDNAAYRATLAATDAFFVSLGWLKPAAK